MFRRTDAGLTAESAFYDTDYVLYCEGEHIDDMVGSWDEMYWETIFQRFGIKVKCKSVGSKGDLDNFMDLVRASNNNIIVAMDRDYDDFFPIYGPSCQHPRIITTFGYSFESDIIFMLTPKVVGDLFLNIKDETAFKFGLAHFLSLIEVDVKRAAIIDLKYYKSSIALFNRKKPRSIIISYKKKPPVLNKTQILKNISSTGHGSPTYPQMHAFGVNRTAVQTFFGKTILHMVHDFFQSMANNYSGARMVHFDIFVSSCIGSIPRSNHNNPVFKYYERIMRPLAKP